MFTPVKKKIDKLVFLNKDQEEKKEHFSKVCKTVIQNLWNGLCEVPHFKEDKYEEEIEAYHGLPNVGVPTHGFIDLYGRYVIETKTLWPRKGKIKQDGTRSWATKQIPTPEKISIDHLSQVALYHVAKEKPVYLIYASDKVIKKKEDIPKAYMTYHAGNCPPLRPENLKIVLKQLAHKAQVMERLLNITTNPKELTKYIIPDFSHFKWQNETDNSLLERAKELWGYK